MSREDYVIKEKKRRFLQADWNYRIKRLPQDQYNNQILDILRELAAQLGSFEPFYTVWKAEAESRWDEELKAQKYYQQ